MVDRCEDILGYMASILSGSALSVLGQGISSFANFATAILVAKGTSPSEYGSYSLIYAGIMLLGSFQNALILSPLRIYGASLAGDDQRGYFCTQLRLQVALGAFLGFAAIGTGAVIPTFGIDATAVIAMCLFSMQLSELFRVVTLTKLALVPLVFQDSVACAVRLGILALLYVSHSITVTSVLLALSLEGLARSLLAGRTNQIAMSSHIVPMMSAIRQNWRYGRWIALESIVHTSSTTIYLYVTALAVDREAVGALSAAQTIVNALNVILMGTTGVMIAIARRKLAYDGYTAWRSWLSQLGAGMVFVIVVMAIVIAVFAETILKYGFSSFYEAYGDVVRILALAYVLTAVNAVLGTAFQTVERPEIGFVARATSAAVTLAIAYPLLRTCGVAGAALGLLLTQVIWLCVYAWHIHRGALSIEQVGNARNVQIN